MNGYSVREVAVLLELSEAEVRGFVRAGFIEPAEADGKARVTFSFRDLVLLRTAKELRRAEISAVRVRRALGRLKKQLPMGRSLSSLSIAADGRRMVVSDGNGRWNPESGQALFDFSVRDLAAQVAPLARKKASAAHTNASEQSAVDWFALGCDLEGSLPEEARDAYRRAVELDPHYGEAHVNLGRMLHEAQELTAAEAYYRLALAAQPHNTTAAFNLAVVVEDLGRPDEALVLYAQTLAIDATVADAHYNMARLYERAGQQSSALRHLAAYKKLTR